ncbi:hypothetical protein ACWNT8_06215 [Pigmentibacter ruber]|uniref:hypothetical protein n=1 Tax=Pigmentibacter ruber TaxID=2683196 RepID=UPI00131DA782|nr:hypothetical protein [Pigmentibacter ruber]BFD33146.1 ADP-ribosylation factor-like protein [Pigmentibacter ruber]
MAFINEATGDIHFKVLYIGSKNAGKTANIQALFCETMANDSSIELNDIIAELPRNNFFDFLPVSYGKIAERNARIHLYTLPSHQLWPTVNISLLLGIDGIVNVIDSRVRFLDKNLSFITEVKKMFDSIQLDFKQIPIIYQMNHSDSYDALPLETLQKNYNLDSSDCVQSVAIQGLGVMETFAKIAEKVVQKVT